MSDPSFVLLPRVINGAIAATVGAAAVFPLDLVKTRLQNQHVGPRGEKQYASMLDCFKQTLSNEGVRGLYSGLAINLSLVGIEKGLKLSANDYFRYFLSSENKRLSLMRQGIAGAGAGTVQILVSTPMELLKIQLQDAGRVVLATSAVAGAKPVDRLSGFAIAAKLFRERGVRGLYRGFVPTAYRDIFFATVYFPLYSAIHDYGPVDADGEAKLYWHLLCGLISGAVCAWIATPFDVVKTRFQAIAKSTGQRQYSGIWDCFTHTLGTEGPTALFKGGVCRIIVIAPLYAITQVVYYIGVAEWLLGTGRQKVVK